MNLIICSLWNFWSLCERVKFSFTSNRNSSWYNFFSYKEGHQLIEWMKEFDWLQSNKVILNTSCKNLVRLFSIIGKLIINDDFFNCWHQKNLLDAYGNACTYLAWSGSFLTFWSECQNITKQSEIPQRVLLNSDNFVRNDLEILTI